MFTVSLLQQTWLQISKRSLLLLIFYIWYQNPLNICKSYIKIQLNKGTILKDKLMKFKNQMYRNYSVYPTIVF